RQTPFTSPSVSVKSMTLSNSGRGPGSGASRTVRAGQRLFRWNGDDIGGVDTSRTSESERAHRTTGDTLGYAQALRRGRLARHLVHAASGPACGGRDAHAAGAAEPQRLQDVRAGDGR